MTRAIVEGMVEKADRSLMNVPFVTGDEELDAKFVKEATAQVLHDDTLWTSDLGELDTEGNLHLTGRLGDTINIGGYKIAPTDVENAAMAMKGMKDCICTKVDSPVFGLTLKLYYVSDQPLSKKEIARFLVQRLERWQVPNLYEKTDHIARTFNGKLDRKKYM